MNKGNKHQLVEEAMAKLRQAGYDINNAIYRRLIVERANLERRDLKDKDGLPVIRPPKYLVGFRDLNEYELRELQVMVATGEISGPISVMDDDENVAYIEKTGKLSGRLVGMDWTVESTMKLLSLNNSDNGIELKAKKKQ